MVDAGGSDQFWPHGYKWALQTAKMLANYDVVNHVSYGVENQGWIVGASWIAGGWL